MATPTLRPAARADLPAIAALLEGERLPTAELEDYLDHFVVAETDGRVIGCGGLEPYAGTDAALVRSMVVAGPWRGTGLGERILSWVTDHARSLGVRRLFLFTMTARDFYARLGFRDTTLDAFPDAARRSAQYRWVRLHGKEWGVVAMERELR